MINDRSVSNDLPQNPDKRDKQNSNNTNTKILK